MKLGEIVQRLERFSPYSLVYFEKQNGLVVGKLNNEVEKIGITLDLTNKTLSKAVENKCDLLVFHNSGNYENISSKGFKKNIREAKNNKIALFQMHLNLDFCKYGIIDNLCKIMGFEGKPAQLSYNGSIITGGVYTAKDKLNLNEIINKIKKLKPKVIIMAGKNKEIYRNIAITSGSGCKSEFIEQSDADVFICGQIGHEAMRTAEELGITLISATNYSTENEPLKLVVGRLQEIIPEVKIEFIDSPDSIKIIDIKPENR